MIMIKNTFYGYEMIQTENSRQPREEELEAMKKARMSNDMNGSKIKESDIGVFRQYHHILFVLTMLTLT